MEKDIENELAAERIELHLQLVELGHAIQSLKTANASKGTNREFLEEKIAKAQRLQARLATRVDAMEAHAKKNK